MAAAVLAVLRLVLPPVLLLAVALAAADARMELVPFPEVAVLAVVAEVTEVATLAIVEAAGAVLAMAAAEVEAAAAAVEVEVEAEAEAEAVTVSASGILTVVLAAVRQV
jgi:hypothetical protein